MPDARERIAAIIDRIDKARAVVSDLCHGRRRWTMSVPARPDEDPDLVIAGALDDARRILSELQPASEEAVAQEILRAVRENYGGVLTEGAARYIAGRLRGVQVAAPDPLTDPRGYAVHRGRCPDCGGCAQGAPCGCGEPKCECAAPCRVCDGRGCADCEMPRGAEPAEIIFYGHPVGVSEGEPVGWLVNFRDPAITKPEPWFLPNTALVRDNWEAHREQYEGSLARTPLYAAPAPQADALAVLRGLILNSYEAYTAVAKHSAEWDEYDARVLPRWIAARSLIGEWGNAPGGDAPREAPAPLDVCPTFGTPAYQHCQCPVCKPGPRWAAPAGQEVRDWTCHDCGRLYSEVGKSGVCGACGSESWRLASTPAGQAEPVDGLACDLCGKSSASGGYVCPSCAARATEAPGERERLLEDLVHHCWMHSGYADCGRSEMTTEERSLYEEAIRAASARLNGDPFTPIPPTRSAATGEGGSMSVMFSHGEARGDYVACPACGYVDEEPSDYPAELMREHCAEMECASCGAAFTALLYVEHTYTTRLAAPPQGGERET